MVFHTTERLRENAINNSTSDNNRRSSLFAQPIHLENSGRKLGMDFSILPHLELIFHRYYWTAFCNCQYPIESGLHAASAHHI